MEVLIYDKNKSNYHKACIYPCCIFIRHSSRFGKYRFQYGHLSAHYSFQHFLIQKNQMIHKVAKKISTWLYASGAISANDIDLYQYATYSFLFSLMPILLVTIIGAIFDSILDGLLMILPFVLIRKFSGGFHFKSSTLCLVTSSVLLSAMIVLIKIITGFQIYFSFTVLVTLSTIGLIKLSPIDSVNRKLSVNEIVIFRKVTVILSISLFIIYTLLMIFYLPRYAVPIGTGIFLSALLQIPCLVKRDVR